MSDLEPTKQMVPVTEIEGGSKALLDQIRERLQDNPDVFLAGELTNKEGDTRFDIHDLFVAPTTPTFDPEELTLFTEKALEGFNMTSSRSARLRQNGDMQLPDAFMDQHIGDREIKTATTTKVTIGSFQGRTGENKEEETEVEKLIQRTTVKVYTDPNFAKTLFDYCQALKDKKLDERQSTNLFDVYATHIAKAEHLEALKKHYQNPGNNLPSSPR